VISTACSTRYPASIFSTLKDRSLRLQALIKIKSDLFKPDVDEKDLKSIFEHGLLRNLLSVVSEKVEKHRELSIDILEA
jgi:hypothetical protein